MLAVEEIWRTEGIELEVLGNGAFRVTARRLHAPRGGMTDRRHVMRQPDQRRDGEVLGGSVRAGA